MYINNQNLYLSKGKKAFKNTVKIGNKFYLLDYLSDKHKKYGKTKGGNSSVFKLIDPENDKNVFAIKFLKYPWGSNVKQCFRFDREIEALYEAKKRKSANVIEIITDGLKKINRDSFRFYVMEKADSDLTSFIQENEIPLNQKNLICYEILKGIGELHSMDLYHRDIKPDNIFVINRGEKVILKVGDLGLSAFRNDDLTTEEYKEKIGPTGWLSPEAMNKVLCEGSEHAKEHSCIIDEKSDIFQLGKLFWFVYKHNIPIGQIRLSDFANDQRIVYSLIYRMLQYKKRRRPEMTFYKTEFLKLAS